MASRVSVVRLFKYDKPKSFGVGNNFAVRHAQYDNLFIINPDTRFIDDSVYQWFQDTDVGSQLYYPKLLNTDGTNQQHYNEWPSIPNQFIRLVKAKLKLPTAQKQKRHDWYFASAIVISKQLFSKLKGFEEIFPLYCEDVDLCYKAYLMGVPFSRIEQVQMVHHLGGEAKHKYLVKAIISNVLWRYVKVRNRILLGNVNRRRNTRYASKH
ncbi:hypothetical protein GCM10007086_11540 [Photobacterium aphoticum]|nr:hypothetical protein GCM10007086_11540 [Photobacterium aphoticum]